MASSAVLSVLPSLLFCIVSLHVSAKIVVPEDGYTVTTIIDGSKLKINPHSVLQLPGSSDLLILDTANSTFYTVQFPTSQDSVVQRFSGSKSGYSDGDVESAQFGKNPRSFTADFNGNVYVADRTNHVIRKISRSGVTTIAGDSSEGKKDGPALNASFSNDFELAFVPGRCVLLVSDHGNRLVRQISLKKEDCTPPHQSGLGAVPAWTLGLGFGLLFLAVIYFVAVRPLINSRTGRLPAGPERRDMEALPNQSGEDSSDTLLRHQKRNC